jgi:hypothetical protein
MFVRFWNMYNVLQLNLAYIDLEPAGIAPKIDFCEFG